MYFARLECSLPKGFSWGYRIDYLDAEYAGVRLRAIVKDALADLYPKSVFPENGGDWGKRITVV